MLILKIREEGNYNCIISIYTKYFFYALNLDVHNSRDFENYTKYSRARKKMEVNLFNYQKEFKKCKNIQICRNIKSKILQLG